jgi:hypothetical protein
MKGLKRQQHPDRKSGQLELGFGSHGILSEAGKSL